MANFSTHVTGAAAGAGLLSTLFLKAGLVDVPDALLLTVSGTVGGILPDIDLKYSFPSKILFTLIGVLCSLLWMFSSENNLAILELWLIGLGIFLVVRYPLWSLFHRFTVHRGAIHSINAAVMFSFAASAMANRVFASSEFMAWLLALFVFSGFLFHLALDELYSVDFLGHRIKKSFGSAMKPFDMDKPGASCIILFITLICWFYTPSSQNFIKKISASSTHEALFENLLPDYVIRHITIKQHKPN